MSDNATGITKGKCYGFVTVRLHPEHGYFGGLLVLNALARPMEFHCTLPVKPSRAQSILYGPTLHDFVCGEQIARALLSKAKSAPAAVFTDTSPVLSVRHFLSVPIGWLESNVEEHQTALALPDSNANRDYKSFKLDDVVLKVPSEFQEDGQVILASWKQQAPQIDLLEPFSRITEALFEANPVAKAA